MILVTGFTGNTGSFVIEKLLSQNNKIIGITRNKSISPNTKNMILEYLSLDEKSKLEVVFSKYPISKVVHIANIRYSSLIMELADKHKVDHVVLVHTTGVYSKYRSYSKLYKEIEHRILNNMYSNTSYTIVRPTMIYGNERDHNMHKLIRYISKYPVFPMFGKGKSLMQPVHVEDLATGIVNVICSPKITKQKDYNLSGGTVVEYKEVVKIIAKELNKKIIFIHIPLKLSIFLARTYNLLFRKKAIITVEQVERLQEDKAYRNNKAKKEINFKPRTFVDGITQEIKILKEKGIIK